MQKLANVQAALFLFLIVFAASCAKPDKVKTRFSLLSSKSTGINFSNQLTESDSLNAFAYLYMYNGSGVGTGDFNNDGLQDIFLGGNMVSGRLYLNKGNMKFEDITESAGLLTDRWVHGVSVVDINGDGFQDIYLSVGGIARGEKSENLLFLNQGDLTFQEAARQYGLNRNALTTHTIFFDYDKDGDLDAYLLNYQTDVRENPNAIKNKKRNKGAKSNDLLLRNDKGRFTDVSAQSGIDQEGYGLGIAPGDFNHDNHLDLYVSNDFIHDDVLYINNGDGTFKNQIATYFKHTSNFGMGIDCGDINNDGYIDLFQLDMLPEDNRRQKKLVSGLNNYDRFSLLLKNGYMPQYMRNSLQLNSGQSGYQEIGYLSGVSSTDWSWSPLIADLDNDGLRDLFITNGYVKDITDVDFRDFVSAESKLRNVAFDPYVMINALKNLKGEKVSNYAYLNRGEYTFENVADQWGLGLPSFSTGAAYADLDNDGDLDLIVNNLNDPAFIYENHTVEMDSARSFLKLSLTVNGNSAKAMGTLVNLKAASSFFTAMLNPYRGFQSTVDARLHFGLGEAKIVDELEIIWPDGMVTHQYNLPVNRMLSFERNAVKVSDKQENKAVQKVFHTDDKSFVFNHKESEFVDFNREPLLPHMLSREGPCSAVADVNHDGLDDIFIGGAAGQPGQLFVQQKHNGKPRFMLSFATEKPPEDTGALFADIDGDNDMDLYVVSGSNEFDSESPLYKDRIYLNDGKGHFSKVENGADFIQNSGSVVAANDFDDDGDIDFFVGAHCVPGYYPVPSKSTLLANESGKFTDVTNTVAPGLERIGMVKDAVWADINGDRAKDLIVTGEFMAIHIYENHKGQLQEKTNEYGLADYIGWWNTLELTDIDGDGDLDILAGNLGLNSRYRATPDSPVTCYTHDFNEDGRIDAVMSYFDKGREVIIHDKMTLARQINDIKKKFVKNIGYAEAGISEVIPDTLLNQSYQLSANHYETSLFVNEGDRFVYKSLPVEVQFSAVNAIRVFDFDEDGLPDVLLGGNAYTPEMLTGRYDAQSTLLLRGMGNGNFVPLSAKNSGLANDGVVQDIAALNIDGVPHFLLLKNNAKSQLIHWKTP